MKTVRRGIRWAVVAAAAVVAALCIDAIFPGANGVQYSAAELEAMHRFRRAQEVLFAARDSHLDVAMRAELARVDPGETGLVGIEWSPLVSTPGSLEAKQSSCDLRWAALFVRWFERAGAGPDRKIAIGASGSFPALLIAAQVAAEAIDATPVVAESLASSNFGATIPTFDAFEIQHVVHEAGIVQARPVLLSPGGDDDRLRGFDEADKAAILARLDAIARIPDAPSVFVPDTLLEGIARREEVLLGPRGAGSDPGVVLFVNVGGHAANYGVGAAALAMPHGYIEPDSVRTFLPSDAPVLGDSVSLRALRAGIPVVNVLDLRSIMLDNGLGYPPPASGTREIIGRGTPPSGVHRVISGFVAVLIGAALWLVRDERKKHDDFALEGVSA